MMNPATHLLSDIALYSDLQYFQNYLELFLSFPVILRSLLVFSEPKREIKHFKLRYLTIFLSATSATCMIIRLCLPKLSLLDPSF